MQEQIIARLSDYESTTGRLADELNKDERTVRGELAALVEMGIVERRAVGRQRFYRLAGRKRSGGRRPGPPRRFTDDQIREQLAALTAQLGHFPSLKEMEAADRSLARIVRASGGVKAWRLRLSR